MRWHEVRLRAGASQEQAGARLPSGSRFPALALPWLLVVYMGASLVHFVHNAQHLSEYPNLPAWLTRTDVYASWCTLAGVGVLGFLLYRLGLRRAGLAVLALYASSGFDGLLHYTRAPLSHHTATMNLTIWTESAAATVLLIAVASVAFGVGRSMTPEPSRR